MDALFTLMLMIVPFAVVALCVLQIFVWRRIAQMRLQLSKIGKRVRYLQVDKLQHSGSIEVDKVKGLLAEDD